MTSDRRPSRTWAAFQREEELYGNAVLSRFPMRLVRSGSLPVYPGGYLSEPRGVLWVEVDLGDRRLQFFNTHLSFRPIECRLQQEALIGPDWLGHPECAVPLVVCGDLNTSRPERLCECLPHRLRDAQVDLEDRPPLPTWSTLLPLRRIDHVLVSTDIEVLGAEVPSNRLTRRASDHLPLVVELSLP